MPSATQAPPLTRRCQAKPLRERETAWTERPRPRLGGPFGVEREPRLGVGARTSGWPLLSSENGGMSQPGTIRLLPRWQEALFKSQGLTSQEGAQELPPACGSIHEESAARTGFCHGEHGLSPWDDWQVNWNGRLMGARQVCLCRARWLIKTCHPRKDRRRCLRLPLPPYTPCLPTAGESLRPRLPAGPRNRPECWRMSRQ